MSLVQSLKERLAGRQADAETRYREMVKSVANGKDVDDSKLLELLTQTSRTADSFSADCELFARRLDARQKLAEADELEPDLKAVQKAARDAEATFLEVRAKAQKEIQAASAVSTAAREKADSFQRRVANIRSNAHSELEATDDPDMKAEIKGLQEQLTEVNSEVNRVGRLGESPDEIRDENARIAQRAESIRSRIDELQAAMSAA